MKHYLNPELKKHIARDFGNIGLTLHSDKFIKAIEDHYNKKGEGEVTVSGNYGVYKFPFYHNCFTTEKPVKYKWTKEDEELLSELGI